MARKKYIFTEEQINYIVENWGKESAHSMKKKFGCSWYAVCRVAEANVLEVPTSNEWTDEDIQTLTELSDKFHYIEIADIMGKSKNAVYLKARRLGITLIQDRRKWTPEEEREFALLWGTIKVEIIAKRLKRTVFSLKVKAVRMGLGPMVRNNSELITISDMCDTLHVTRDRIMGSWQELGLNLKKKKLTNNRAYYYVIWEDLMSFLKNNQNEWDSRKLEKHMLGLEPDWLKEKRIRDKKENPLWYRRWTMGEINKAEMLFKCGKDYAYIAKELDRTEGAIAILLRELGYSYGLPKYWKGKEIKYLRENYEDMTYAEIAQVLRRTTKAVGAKAEELGFQKRLVNNINTDYNE